MIKAVKEWHGISVTLTLELVDDRYECVQLIFDRMAGGPEVKAVPMRTMPLHRWTREAVDGQRPAVRVDRVCHCRRQDCEVELKQVADIYRSAHRARIGRLDAVAHALNMPKSTAARWVKNARRAGHLPPTTTGKAKA